MILRDTALWLWLYIVFLLHLLCGYECLEPITIGFGVGMGLTALNWDFLKSQTYCRYIECCDDKNVLTDIGGVRRILEKNLFGQHIVLQHLIPALEAHLSPHSISRKPLVMSFHGPPGTGKNFVSQLIAESLFKEGLKSRFVHKFMGRSDFPLATHTDVYKERISNKVREGVAECSRSLYIFDEVDKMPEGVFESLTSLIDYNVVVNGKENTKAIFLFLSNTGGVHISDHLGALIKNGMMREETKLSHFEPILQKAAYNLEGGFKKTALIEAHAIDHYLPFLPLEKQHVIKCLEAEFRRWGSAPNQKAIGEILDEFVTYDHVHKLFATSGCKTLEKKVAIYAGSKYLLTN